MAVESVFICHSPRDEGIAARIAADLRRAGIRVWRPAEQTGPEKEWNEETVSGVSDAAAVLYMVSRDFHPPLAQVASFAPGSVIPVIVDGTDRDDIPLRFQGCRSVHLTVDYQRGMREILGMLGREREAQAWMEELGLKCKCYVFISYAEEDAEFVCQLRDFLRKNGYAYWDYAESERQNRGQLFLEMESVIKAAAATLCVLSNAWRESEWTMKEYQFARDLGIPVYLLKAEEIAPTLMITGMLYIDFAGDKERGFRELGRELRQNVPI